MPTTAKRPSAGRPICIDLFAGAGGLSLGFEQAGFDIVAAVEIDPIHAATHEFNFPETPVVCQDIKKVTGTIQFTSPENNSMTSILLTPIPITKDNLNVVLDAGWITKDVLCKDVTAGSVPGC